MTQPANNPDAFSPIEEAVQISETKLPTGGTAPKPPRQRWPPPMTTAPCSRPSWRPACRSATWCCPPAGASGFTANFAVITVVLQFAAEDGIAPDALANIDTADTGFIQAIMLRPDRTEEILARGGMALQPDENWRMVLAQLDKDSFTELVSWLLTAAVVGVGELAATGEDDGQGEAPEPSAA